MTTFEQLLIEAANGASTEQIDNFFFNEFEYPLLLVLKRENETQTPASAIRQRLQQTEKIKNYFLTLKKK